MRNTKLLTLSILATAGLFHTASFAAKKHAPKTQEQIENINRTQSVSVYPLGFFVGRFGANYGFEVSENIALKIGASGRYMSAGLFGNDYAMFDLGPTLGARFHLTDAAFNSGWFIEPTVGFNFGSASTNSGNAVNGWSFAAQALGGYAWYWDSGFTLSLAGGLDYSLYSSNIQDLGSNRLGTWALIPHPTVDFSLGYSW